VLKLSADSPDSSRIVVHPRWQKWAEDFPELYKLENVCPPIGGIIASCRNNDDLSVREEKVVFQTLGFLPRAKTLLHYLCAFSGEYNPHLIDFKISRIRGTPLGCRRIHSLLGYEGDYCRFETSARYCHPLLHFDRWQDGATLKSEKVENLTDAIGNLNDAIEQVRRFLK
jgi:hypothetical protein